MDKNIKLVERFFKSDLRIKQILNNLAPNDMDGNYNYSYAAIQYEGNLYKGLKELREEFNIIVDIFHELGVENSFGEGCNIISVNKSDIDKIFNNYLELLANCSSSYDKLVDFYKKYLVSMSKEVIDKTKKTCIGYLMFSDPRDVFLECVSLNEMLHVFHSALVNNEGLYKVMPKLDMKMYDNGDVVTLYGKDNDMARDMFFKFPKDSNNGVTDILALESKILIMVRDRGHALTLEIEPDMDGVYVKYFIPKICNMEMVNNLRGVIKANSESFGTSGEFRASYDSVSREVVEFIEMVPTDDDLDFWYVDDIKKSYR